MSFMIKYWCCIGIMWIAQIGLAQDLTYVIQSINPALYINNMDNQPVYHQSIMSSNSLVFTRLYGHNQTEQKEQSYHYCFLNEKHQNWVLEIRLDQHDFHVSDGHEMQAVRSSDFGIQVYQLQGEEWKEVTQQVLPEDFKKIFQAQFPDLQPSSWGYYYYNQNPELVIQPTLKKKVLHFEQNGKRVLCLAWRRRHFVWK